MFNPEFLATDNNDGQDGNALIQYLQEQSPDVLQRVAKSASPDIQDIIRHNVQGLLGMLPGEQFEVVRKAPFGGPIAILISSYILSIRREDARRIAVKVLIDE